MGLASKAKWRRNWNVNTRPSPHLGQTGRGDSDGAATRILGGKEFAKQLRKQFKVKYLGPANNYLGLENQ